MRALGTPFVRVETYPIIYIARENGRVIELRKRLKTRGSPRVTLRNSNKKEADEAMTLF